MSITWSLIKKEWRSYFFSPVAYVFLIIFLISLSGSSFFLVRFFDIGRADLHSFFLLHPWFFLFLIPAIGMGIWSEERNQGTIELLLTFPISALQATIAKFVAAWLFIGVALLLTFPMVLTVTFLGNPDMGVIFTSYIGSFLMAGAYLSITCLFSALSNNQVTSFIISVVICLISILLGWGVFRGMLSSIFSIHIAETISNFSLYTHYVSLQKGVLDSRDIIFFLSLMLSSLGITVSILEAKKAI